MVQDLEGEIRDRFGASTDKAYAVYYAGRSGDVCGSASTEGLVAVAFLDPEGCSPRPVGGDRELASTYEAVMAHELLHVFGAVPECAPDRLETSAHVGTSVGDLMYAGPEWSGHDEVVIDGGRDNYFGHGQADCVDTSTSEFWEPVSAVETRVPGVEPPRPVIPSEDWPVRCGLLPRAAEADRARNSFALKRQSGAPPVGLVVHLRFDFSTLAPVAGIFRRVFRLWKCAPFRQLETPASRGRS